MSSGISIRNIDPGDKSWVRREARQAGVSMEEFVRSLIREARAKQPRLKPSEAFARYFGKEYGFDLPPPDPVSYRPVVFPETDDE